MTARTTLLAWTLAALMADPVKAEPRFTAEFADGARVAGDEIVDWHDSTPQPLLDHRPLFNPANPVRWLRDNSLAPAAPPVPRVEFWLGDQAPGRLTVFRADESSKFLPLPPHLLIEPESAAGSRAADHAGPLRVLPRWVRRIVWQSRAGDAWQPGTLFRRDGGRLRFRSLTWGETSVQLRLADESVEVPFSAIAELHMPPIDAWDRYYEQVASQVPIDAAASAPPGMPQSLVRLECADGLQATCGTARYLPRSPDSSGDPEQWIHVVQPVWSLDPLWLRHRAIRLRRYWQPHEVPLSAIDVAFSLRQPIIARAWSWRADRNARGGVLRSAGEEHPDGFGVYADCRLEFDVPPAARLFRVRIGLDDLVGGGGCARAAVVLREPMDLLLFQSPLLIGSRSVADSGSIAIPTSAGPDRRLALIADSAHDGRPAGADPLDIRDCLNWISPRIDLDRGLLAEECRRRTGRLVHAWRGWTAEDHDAGLESVARWDESAGPANGGFRMYIAPHEPFMKLSRRQHIAAGHGYLLIAASAPAGGSLPRLQIQVDGRPVATFDVPPQPPRGDPDPMVVSMGPFMGRQAMVEVLQLPVGGGAHIDWRALQFVDRHPGTLPLFEDDPSFANSLDEGPGVASIVENGAYRGRRAVQVSIAERRGNRLDRLPISIREYPRLGEYRFLRFAWRKMGGDRICLGLGHDGRFGPDSVSESQPRRSFRYDAGIGGASMGLALRLERRRPDDWTVVTRDLYADFGAFDLSGLLLSCPDGDAALFDHIHLGRTMADLDRLDEPFDRPIGPN